MQQPELGIRLTTLRKEKNLTQEELVEKSHVSVRTIQRIESGEVMPRVSTIKILFEALGESYESQSKPTQAMEQKKENVVTNNSGAVLTAVLAGAVYLVAQIILGTMDVVWIVKEDKWGNLMNDIYIALTVIMVVAYVLFARGFITLSNVFENRLLKVISYILIVGTACMGVLDVTSLRAEEMESLWAPYMLAALLFGPSCIVFGVALIRLQDSMGTLARIAGILEIAMGCMLITVILFFATYVIMIPAVVVEILVLYRGYEYLSKTPSSVVNS